MLANDPQYDWEQLNKSRKPPQEPGYADRGVIGPSTQAPALNLGGPVAPPRERTLPTLPSGDYGQNVNQVQQANFAKYSELMDPIYKRQQDEMRARLANQGIPVGSEAWNWEQDALGRQQALGRNQAALESVLMGGQEQSRLAGLDLARAQYGLGAEQAGFGMDVTRNQNYYNQMMQARAQRLNELAAILGGQPVGGGFQQAPLDAAGPYGQAASAAMNAADVQNNYQAQQNANRTNAAASIIAALITRSARAIKDHNEEISTAKLLDMVMSLPVERWRYKGDDKEFIGPYAEDWNEATGLDDGKTISILSEIGVVMGAVQEIAKQMTESKDNIEALSALVLQQNETIINLSSIVAGMNHADAI